MDFKKEFNEPVIKIGRLCMFFALIASFIPSIYLWIAKGAVPEVGYVLAGYVLIASTQAPYYFIEPISYFPILGLSGTYMSFLTGSISGVRLPTTGIVQNIMGVTPGTPKAEVVTTLAIAGSVIVTTVGGLIAVTFGSLLIEALPASIVGAFDFVLCAVFGSTFGSFAVKDPKIAVVALTLAIVVNKFFAIPAYFTIPGVIFATVGIAVFLYNKKEKKGEVK